jgi:hypothetical protein
MYIHTYVYTHIHTHTGGAMTTNLYCKCVSTGRCMDTENMFC